MWCFCHCIIICDIYIIPLIWFIARLIRQVFSSLSGKCKLKRLVMSANAISYWRRMIIFELSFNCINANAISLCELYHRNREFVVHLPPFLDYSGDQVYLWRHFNPHTIIFVLKKWNFNRVQFNDIFL